MPERPEVKVGEWVSIGDVEALVISISTEYIFVGHFANGREAVKEEAIWHGTGWRFMHPGANASYLYGSKAMVVKRGPQKDT